MCLRSDWKLVDLEHTNACQECGGVGTEQCGCGGDPRERCEICNGTDVRPCRVCDGSRFHVPLSTDQLEQGLLNVSKLASYCQAISEGGGPDSQTLEDLQDEICDLYSLPSVGWMARNGHKPNGVIGSTISEDVELWLYWFQGQLMARCEPVEPAYEPDAEYVVVDVIA